jgi:hypothetical protein
MKPSKKSDKELWNLIELKIQNVEYVFLTHAKKRQIDRNISDIDVLDLLENKKGRKRKRNKSKDTYINSHDDWNYCIEGVDIDNKKIRVIISFDRESMLVITVIRLEE